MNVFVSVLVRIVRFLFYLLFAILEHSFTLLAAISKSLKAACEKR